jgi:hypothetical protein
LETASAEEMATMDVPLKLDEAREEITETKHFHRKKSRQSLEPAEPTIHQQQAAVAFTASGKILAQIFLIKFNLFNSFVFKNCFSFVAIFPSNFVICIFPFFQFNV